MASTEFRQPLTSALNLSGEEWLDLRLLRRILQAIDVRLEPLQEQQASVEAALESLRGVALDRINTVLTPAIERVFTLTERGFLIANSATEATLAVGNILTFTISDEVERELFTPSPFVALTRQSTPDDYAVARTISYDAVSGTYRCEVVSFTGDAGPHSDWTIGALAGATTAQYALLAEGQTVRDVILAARDTALSHREAAAASATTAGTAATTATQAAGTAVSAANAAASSAEAAAQFDPSAFYTKDEIDSQSEGYASDEQGAKADTALQPQDADTILTTARRRALATAANA